MAQVRRAPGVVRCHWQWSFLRRRGLRFLSFAVPADTAKATAAAFFARFAVFSRSGVTILGQETITPPMNCVQTQGGRLDRESGRRTPTTNRARGDEGAALVEMAIVSIILFALLFGIIDFGWSFMKTLDVRHGAREVGRLAAVNFDDLSVTGSSQGQRIVNAACDRMDGDNQTTVILDVSSDAS